MITRIIIAFSFLVLCSCTWVKLNAEAESVVILTPAEFSQRQELCNRVGSTQVSVLDKVVLSRSARKVEQELATLARNQAAARGNVLLATSEIESGEQTFDIYQCEQ